MKTTLSAYAIAAGLLCTSLPISAQAQADRVRPAPPARGTVTVTPLNGPAVEPTGNSTFNTGSPAGLSGGPGLGDTPSTAPTGIDPGTVRVRRALPVRSRTGSIGITHSTGAGLGEASTVESDPNSRRPGRAPLGNTEPERGPSAR